MNYHAAYIALIIFLLGLVIVFYNRYLKEKKESDHKSSIIAEKTDSIRYHVNRNGRLVAEKTAAEGTIKELKEAYPRLAEELKREFDVRMKDMRAYIKNEFQARGSGEGEIHNHYYTDSTGRKVPRWEVKAFDGYLDFRATVTDTTQVQYTYTYSDTIKTVVSEKKKWWFGKTTLYASSTLSNPNAKITGSQNLLVDTYKDKRWCVWAGVGYDFIGWKPILGVGIGYSLLKF